MWELLRKHQVVIPIIQRDYAQGRISSKVTAIRDNILNALFNAIKTNEAIELDFIYGSIKVNGDPKNEEEKFYPLDGQQRLTTLFLIHWYVAAKEGYLEEARPILSRFSYETRHSSRVFCSELVKHRLLNFDEDIREEIINQPWFFTAWINDPTINSMLTMLNAIQDKIRKFEIENAWEKLTSLNPPIVFHLLATDKLGMQDDLYIKMNSRGKELTGFEYFKIRFSEILNKEHSQKFNLKIDQEWSDLFWNLYKDEEARDIAQKVDNGFLRFFRYITDIIMAVKQENLDNTEDEFEVFNYIYKAEDNVTFLFDILDTFTVHNRDNPDYFSGLLYIDPKDYGMEKTRIFFINPAIDLFKKCADSYDTSLRNNPFSIGEQLLFYAVIVHLKNRTEDFNRRLRTVRNLITNSEDTVRKENMESLVTSVYNIITRDYLEEENKFNRNQQNEEVEKKEFLMKYPNIADTVYHLEDHHLLQGSLSVFDLTLQLDSLAKAFYNTFTKECDYLGISRALFTIGDYSQEIVKYETRFFGNKNASTWRDLFTPSIRRGDFKNTKEVLRVFLERIVNNPSLTIESIIESYLLEFDMEAKHDKDWRYYFIKYEEFRQHLEGYYYWKDRSKPYELMMLRRKTTGGYHWDPFLYAIKDAFSDRINMGNYGEPLVYVKNNIEVQITNHNDYFKFEGKNGESKEFLNRLSNQGLLSEEYKYFITMSEDGFDIEDRIERGRNIIGEFDSL